MGLFDEQIIQRKLSDQEILEESLFHITASVLGRRQAGKLDDERISTKAAIDEILKYYHIRISEIPENITELEEQLEYSMRPHGVMWRGVELEEDWYRDAMGPMLAFRKEDGAPVALLPKPVYGYRYIDPARGEEGIADRKTARLFQEDAICFYAPLPQRKLGLRDLAFYLKERLNTGDFVLLCFLTLAVTILGLLMTNITRALTGFVLESRNVSLLMGTAVFMISVILSTQLISAARQLMMSRIGTKASVALEAAMMMRILNLPASFFRKHASGELSSRYDAVKQLCGLLLGNVISMGLSALFSLLYIGQIFHYAPELVKPAFLVIAANVILSLLAGLTQMRVSAQIMEKSAGENALSFALITGVQKIKLAGAEKRAFAKWGHVYAEAADLTYNPPMLLRVNAAVSSAIALAGTIAMFYLAAESGVSPSEYIAFSTAYGAVTASFSALTGVALSLAGVRPVLEMAEPILSEVPETSENRTMVTHLNGNIELSNVYFRYSPNAPWVISGMNLRIHSGDYVAIVGTTGCGKSTLVRLLLGFESPEIGEVFYDGKEIEGLDLHSLRRRIGTVTQDGSLFQGDIYSNILISAPQMTPEDAWEAAEIAGIADDIRNMPMGMHTQISEGQGGISGGQKQRLMIARAVAPKPDILIFDEATSALDNITQQKVSEALDRLKCTRIVIAHRLSTIRNCSRILVLDQGKIIEEGTYEELTARNGMFADLIARQRLDV